MGISLALLLFMFTCWWYSACCRLQSTCLQNIRVRCQNYYARNQNIADQSSTLTLQKRLSQPSILSHAISLGDIATEKMVTFRPNWTWQKSLERSHSAQLSIKIDQFASTLLDVLKSGLLLWNVQCIER